jgi:hypothetical protein
MPLYDGVAECAHETDENLIFLLSVSDGLLSECDQYSPRWL